MSHTNLQPIGRFAFLALGFHALLGAGLWWWFHAANDKPQSLTWVSPADFQSARPLPPPAAQVNRHEIDSKSMLAVVGVSKTPPLPEPVPKAIAIDPAKAMELMKIQQAGVPKPTPAATLISPPSPAVVAAASTAAPSPPPPPPAPAPTAAAVTEAAPPSPPKTQAEKPEVKTKPASASASPPASDVSRFITVSKCDPPAKNSASLLDIASLDSGTAPAGEDKNVRLDEVDRAIIDGFRRNWNPPPVNTLSLDQRTAHMNVTVDRTGRVLKFTIAKRSGNDNFDYSLIEAANRLDKIDAQLPASYPEEHYEFQVHFHVE